ncbi:MAG: hypothetical protein AABY64_01905 [Bdellovibrionota bacterium]
MQKVRVFFSILCISLTAIAEPDLREVFKQRLQLNYQMSVLKIVDLIVKEIKIEVEGTPLVLPPKSDQLAILATKKGDLCSISEEAASVGFRSFSITCLNSEGRAKTNVTREIGKYHLQYSQNAKP